MCSAAGYIQSRQCHPRTSDVRLSRVPSKATFLLDKLVLLSRGEEASDFHCLSPADEQSILCLNAALIRDLMAPVRAQVGDTRGHCIRSPAVQLVSPTAHSSSMDSEGEYDGFGSTVVY